MNTLRRTTFAAACLLMNGAVVWAQTSVSIGVQIGPPPPPRVVYVEPPPPPEPEYVWVEGYWYPVDRHHYVWHDGYWTRPPYPGARWIGGRYERQTFYAGYWQGPRGVIVHDHRWDRDHDRDFHGDRGRKRGHH